MSDVFFAGGTDVEFQIWDFRFEISAVISFFFAGGTDGVCWGNPWARPGTPRIKKLTYKNPLDTWTVCLVRENPKILMFEISLLL